MEDKLRRYVDGLFARTAPTKKAIELKEEMLQNLQDKYSDLIGEGKTPEAAYNIVIAGIGDVGGLLYELETEAVDEQQIVENEVGRRKSAMFTAIAVMSYILSFLPIMILSMMNSRFTTRIGLPFMFLIIAGATGLLIYNSLTRPKSYKDSNTMVAEFRQWQSGAQDRKQLRRAISSALWTIIVALYFIISFATDGWAVTWIIFLLGAAVEALINVFTALRK